MLEQLLPNVFWPEIWQASLDTLNMLLGSMLFTVLLGLPLGIDVCYTNHAEADQDDMDNLLTLLAAAGVNFIMGVPGADDVMLNYQSTSFHDALYVRDLFGLKRAPEFDDWLARAGLAGQDFRLVADAGRLPDLAARLLT